MVVSFYRAASKIPIGKEKLSAASDTPRTHPSRENASRAWKKGKRISTVGKPAAPIPASTAPPSGKLPPVCGRKTFLAPTAARTFPLLPTWSARGASGRLCRSRGCLLRSAPGLDWTFGSSAVGRTLRSHPRSQQRSAATGTCAPETRLVSYPRRRPPETQTAARLSVTVARRPRRHSHRHPLQPYL